MLLIRAGEFLVFVSVTVCALLVAPTNWSGKSMRFPLRSTLPADAAMSAWISACEGARP